MVGCERDLPPQLYLIHESHRDIQPNTSSNSNSCHATSIIEACWRIGSERWMDNGFERRTPSNAFLDSIWAAENELRAAFLQL